MVLVSVKDNLTGFYPCVCDKNEEVAIRNFVNACRAQDSLVYANKNDFSLFKLGEFNSETGEIIPCCECLITGSSILLKED